MRYWLNDDLKEYLQNVFVLMANDIKTTADSFQININVTFLFCQHLYREIHYIQIFKASFSVHISRELNDRSLFTCKKLLMRSLWRLKCETRNSCCNGFSGKRRKERFRIGNTPLTFLFDGLLSAFSFRYFPIQNLSLVRSPSHLL
jgi:hypothetical protein